MMRKSSIPLLLLCLLIPAGAYDDWTQASGAFKKAMGGSSEEQMEKAVGLVVRDNSERAVKLLVRGMKIPDIRFYWIIIDGLSHIGSREGVDTLVHSILENRDGAIRRDLMMALQKSGSPFVEDALLSVLEKGSPDVRLTAIDELVKRGSKKAIQAFLDLAAKREKEDGEIKRQLYKGLRALTGRDLGTSAGAWQSWWAKNRDTFKVGGGEEKAKPAKPGETVAGTLKRNRTTDYEDLKRGAKHEIVVVSGVFDEIQQVLTELNIPHAVVNKDEFSRFDLRKTSALIINCDDYNAKRFTKPQIQKVRQFVAGGGYLFTSDWGIVDVLEDAFPGYVKKGGEIPPEMHVKIFPKKGSTGHPFLKEVFVKITREEGGEGKSSSESVKKLDFNWLIDAVSFTIKYDPKRVVVLVESPELKDSYKHTAVAVTFLFGEKPKKQGESVATGGVYEDLPNMRGGKVLHILSHFKEQKTRDDDFAIQNMLLNFLIEAKDRKLMRQRARRARRKK